MGILVDDYMMLLQRQNGDKVIVDTRPALKAQLKKVVEWIVRHSIPLDMVSSAHSGIALSEDDWQALLKEVE